VVGLRELTAKFRSVWPLLNERTRRLMAASEAKGLGHGGVTLVTGVVIKDVTLSSNCFSGIIVIAGSDNELEANVSVRNGSPAAPCGGI
jgi:hypothetical protein